MISLLPRRPPSLVDLDPLSGLFARLFNHWARGQAIGGLLRMPPPISVRHMTIPRVSVGERLSHLRTLLSRGVFSFDEAVRDADRVTVAVTLVALLELYKRGEARWEQSESFGEISIHACATGEVLPAE